MENVVVDLGKTAAYNSTLRFACFNGVPYQRLVELLDFGGLSGIHVFWNGIRYYKSLEKDDNVQLPNS